MTGNQATGSDQDLDIILGTMTFSGQVNAATATDMITAFQQAGHTALDTAYVYNKGGTETLLGELNTQGVLQGTHMAGKANPAEEGGLSAGSVRRQLETSLQRLRMESLDLFYLHSPDLNVPIRETLQAVADLHQKGRFQRFGLSNYAAWQVAEISEICRAEGWIMPTVYQGMYNALTRDVERELFPCLRNYGIAFYAYNPLAGGLLSGKHQSVDEIPPGGRFADFAGYQSRYWKPEYFEVINRLSEQCRAEDIEPAAAALRWLCHHSALTGPATDSAASSDRRTPHALIIGASSMRHFEQNLQACAAGALPSALVNAFDEGWEEVRPACIKYFRP
ncbi:aldo/keto reductase family protein [Granulosicoccus sp. 3-233]|uniref:aldo/keto reductase family protein n=1 Tax=Granulosicoccus sp. 3-233 TaxID=3417969 RepID=UPI003D32AEBF